MAGFFDCNFFYHSKGGITVNSVKNNVTLEGSNELLKKVIRFLTRNGNVELDFGADISLMEV